MRRVIAIAALVSLLAIPGDASATVASSLWWRHGGDWTACVSAAQAALVVAGFSGVGTNDTSHAYGTVGEYAASIRCIDQITVLTVAGPQQSVADSLAVRIRDSWR